MTKRRNKFLAAAAMGVWMIGPSTAQEVGGDVGVDLTVTAEPQITVSNINDVSLSSDGVDSTPGTALEVICVTADVSDVRVTVAKQNPLNNGLPSLTNTAVGDYINYSISANVDGLGPPVLLNTTDTIDYQWQVFTFAAPPCINTNALLIRVTPETDPSQASRSISETVTENGLSDGTPYVFSDTLTVTFEPIL